MPSRASLTTALADRPRLGHPDSTIHPIQYTEEKRTIMRHRSLAAIGLAAVASLGLAACGGGSSSDASDSSSGVVTLTVGATPSPHAKILTYINDNLAAAEGIKLDIVEYTDYIQPNTALNDGDLDANFYQTVPYLENAEKQFGFDFEAGEGIHLEPLGVFSNKHKSLDELPDGGTIGIINDTANQSRALELLATQGLVSIPEGDGDVNINTVTKLKNFNFREVEGPQLVRSLDDFDYAVINGNFAQEGGKTISGDALVVESPVDNPAVNILVWKGDSKKADAIAKLEKLLHSDEVKQYIEKTWSDGSVIPAF